MPSDLAQLKNLGATSINILRTIGIHTYEDLKAAGPVDIYCRVKARNINVSKVMLYAVEGAIRDIPWNELSVETKRRLVEDAEKALAQRQKAEAASA